MWEHNFELLPEMLLGHMKCAREALDLIEEHSEKVVGPPDEDRSLVLQLQIAMLFGYSAALELDLELGGLDAPLAKLLTVAVMDGARDMKEVTTTIERLIKAMNN